MIPVYKIETYTGAVLDHTITSDAFNINAHDRVTDAIGQFTIALPSGSQFEDIALHDTVKIYLGYDSTPANPNFVGKVQKIEDGFTKGYGYVRKISGLALGEILLRRIKCGHYSGMQASDIVKEFAADLSLGDSEVVAETATPPFEFVNETYFDAMQKVSDVWISAGVQLKKEFDVNTSNNLRYKTRPLGTSGETLEVGNQIIDYTVRRSLENLKNNITVYGDWDELFTIKVPTDESWTEPTSGGGVPPEWVQTIGTLSMDTGDKVQGTASLKCASAGSGIAYDVDFYRYLKPQFAFITGNARTITQSFSRLHFQAKGVTTPTNDYVELWSPDYSNRFYHAIGWIQNWTTSDLTLPTTDALNGWTKVANAQASFITALRFTCHYTSAFDARLDDLALQGGRFCYSISDATSITEYGQRDLVVIEDSLKSNTQCEARARTLLYQRKDPITETEISLLGNTNILVGDRIALNLPRASVNANFDITEVDHTFTKDGFFTRLTAIQGAENRYSVSVSPMQEISRLKVAVRGLSRDLKLIR